MINVERATAHIPEENVAVVEEEFSEVETDRETAVTAASRLKEHELAAFSDQITDCPLGHRRGDHTRGAVRRGCVIAHADTSL
jgi:hypothetical protein